MILQNIVIPKEINELQELYVRGKCYIDKNELCINALETITTDTYMNYFDIGLWKKYTEVAELKLDVLIKGCGKIVIHYTLDNKDNIIKVVSYNNNVGYKLEIDLGEFQNLERGYLWLECIAKEFTRIKKIEYCTNQCVYSDVRLTLIICTYQRKEAIEKNLKILETCELLQNNLLQVKVVDNGQELDNKYGHGIKIYHNPNTGGSGGFKRGMEETVIDYERYPTTNVILMDDDVLFELEIFQRIYSFLSYEKAIYKREVLAGRMFRLDDRSIQYTAVENWNGGEIIHIWGNLDMRDKRNLISMNDNTNAEYSGWWLATYPYEFIRDNKPLPFFLHCDDVEFGLRHGGNPIIINGIHVWHETFEYRQSPMIVYYDTRNSLIVNSIYGKVERPFLDNINTVDIIYQTFILLAVIDYFKGYKWFENINIQKIQLKLNKYTRQNKYIIIILNYYLKIKLRKEEIYFGKRAKKITKCNN